METFEKQTTAWVEINNDGTFNRSTLVREKIGNADELLSRLAQESPITVKSIGRYNPATPILSMAMKQGSYFIWGMLEDLTLNCGWQSRSGVLTPLFVHNDAAIQLSLKWKAPDNMKLYFLVAAGRPNSMFRMSEAYMVAVSTHPEAKGWLQIPLANTYDDGRLCLGLPAPATGESLVAVWGAAHDRFCGASFNADLAYDHIISGSRELFRFDAGSTSQMPVRADWHTACRRMNHTHYSMIQQ